MHVYNSGWLARARLILYLPPSFPARPAIDYCVCVCVYATWLTRPIQDLSLSPSRALRPFANDPSAYRYAADARANPWRCTCRWENIVPHIVQRSRTLSSIYVYIPSPSRDITLTRSDRHTRLCWSMNDALMRHFLACLIRASELLLRSVA